jgi:hypothetical protein
MTQQKTIKIDEVEYVRADSVPPREGDIKIVILDRGFVYVGYVKIDDDFLVITNAKNIRAWGTSKGLGELVNGPLPSTKLDNAGTVRAPLRALIHMIDVEQSKWNCL